MKQFIIALCWFGVVMAPFTYHIATKFAIVEPTSEMIEFE